MKKKLLLLLFIAAPHFLFAQWQECSTPFYGSAIQLETFDNYTWAGTTDGGVYRTTNQQPNWESANVGLTSTMDKQIYSLKVIGNALYAGCRGGLYKKSNANANWVQLLDYYYPAMDIVEGGTNVLLAGMYGQVRRSTDGGVTWQPSNLGLPLNGQFDIRTMVYDAATSQILINLGGIGLYASTNQGQSWSAINYPGGFAPASAFITMLKKINNVVYAGVEPQGLYSWNSTSANWQLIATTSARITDMIIVNNNYVTTSSFGIQSAPVNGGTQFNYVIGNAPSFLSAALSVEQRNNQIYIGGYNECVMMIDTLFQVYSFKKEGMKASPIEFLSGNGTALLTHGDKQHYNYRSTDEFTSASITMDSALFSLYDNSTDDYAVAQSWFLVGTGKGISMSTDGGLSFRQANNGLPASVNQTYTMSSICNTGAGFMISGSRDGKFYRSLNDSTWVLQSDLASPYEKIDRIIPVGNYLFAATQNATQPSSSHLYRSSDNGLNWQILPGPFQSGRSVYGLVYDGTRLIAGSSGYGTFASTDFAQTWTTINHGLAPYVVFRKLKTFNGNTFAVANNEQLLYRLLPNDTTWNCLNCNLGAPSANDVYYQNGTLFLGSADNGIWKWPSFILGITEPQSVAWSLYPNPSSNCIIELTNDYTLPLIIKLTDAGGKLVYTKTITCNSKSIYLNSTELNKGMYFVILSDNKGNTTTKKWIVE